MNRVLIMGVALIAQTSLAAPALTCLNGASGAQFEVGQYSSNSPNYWMNGNLAGSLNNQLTQHGGTPVQMNGSGGTIQYGPNASYSVSTNNGSITLSPQGNGYRLYAFENGVGTATFYFNPGECKNDAI